MLKIRWREWRAVPAARRCEIIADASAALGAMEGQGSAAFSLLGHKGDLMLVHFRPSFDGLGDAQRALPKLALWDYLESTTSYVSVVELGLYDSSIKLYSTLAEKQIAANTPEWNEAIEETLGRQRQAMQPRLFPEIPPAKYLCFY